MILSIIVLFCDKDVKYVPQILKNIEEKVQIPHEVILVDNRDNDKTDLPKGDYKLVGKGYNTYQLEGRRLGLDIAKGQYTWYVDVDDTIIDTITLRDVYGKLKSDIIQFYSKDSQNGIQIHPGTRHGENIRCFGVFSWCRFYNTTLLKNLLSPIKRDLKFMGYEDTFFYYIMSENARIINYIDKVIYQYNIERSVRKDGAFTKDKYDQLEVGIDNLYYLSQFIKENELFINEINSARQYQYHLIQ